MGIIEKSKMNSKISIKRLANNPFSKFFEKIDTQITDNFRIAGVSKRPVEGNGVWCCALIPSILVLYTIMFKVPREYKLTTFLSIGLFVYSVLFTLFVYLSSLVLRERNYAGVTASAIIAALPLYLNLNNIVFSLSFAVFTTVSYCHLLNITIFQFHNTFTLGEAMVVCQEIVLFFMYSVVNLYLYIYEPETVEMDVDMFMIKIFVLTAFTTVGLIVTALFMLEEEWKDLKILGYIVTTGAAYAVITIHSLLGINAIPRLFWYIFRDFTRVKLFVIWLLLVAASVVILVTQTWAGHKVTSATRKSFHLLAAVVFMTGIIADVNLLMLAAGLIFALLIMVEAMRLSHIEPVSSLLQAAFEIYSDEKDAGLLAVTPLALYMGLACPLVLVPWRPGAELELLSGFLAIGIGDAAASYFGERYGQKKWPNSSKTLEGTVCNVLSQILVVYALDTFELINIRACLLRTAIAAGISALVEGLTDQVDNLILPLITILAFQTTALL